MVSTIVMAFIGCGKSIDLQGMRWYRWFRCAEGFEVDVGSNGCSFFAERSGCPSRQDDAIAFALSKVVVYSQLIVVSTCRFKCELLKMFVV